LWAVVMEGVDGDLIKFPRVLKIDAQASLTRWMWNQKRNPTLEGSFGISPSSTNSTEFVFLIFALLLTW
jgi:hypothetical protein